jgi:hypothetical protein
MLLRAIFLIAARHPGRLRHGMRGMREEEANLSVEIVADVAEKLVCLNPTNRAWTVLAVHHLNAVDAEEPLTSPLRQQQWDWPVRTSGYFVPWLVGSSSSDHRPHDVNSTEFSGHRY